MEIKTTVPLLSRVGFMEPGWTFKAELKEESYIVQDGFFKGAKVPKTACEVVEEKADETRKAFEDYYLARLNKEREEKERAQEFVKHLTDQLRNKNKEIEKLTFFLDAAKLALSASVKAIETLKGKAN